MGETRGVGQDGYGEFCFATQRGRFPEIAIGIYPELLEYLGQKTQEKRTKNRQKLDKYSATPILAAKKLLKTLKNLPTS